MKPYVICHMFSSVDGRILPDRWHPAVHAHMAATVDMISNGRLDFGIGAGWNEYEHQSMGIPLYTPGERIQRLGEACEIARRLFTQHLTDFEGRYYQLKQARCEPKPIQKPYPPFVIGGSGEQLTLRVVARYADVWNFASTDVEIFRDKVRVLLERRESHRTELHWHIMCQMVAMSLPTHRPSPPLLSSAHRTWLP